MATSKDIGDPASPSRAQASPEAPSGLRHSMSPAIAEYGGPWELAICDDDWPMVATAGDIVCVPDPNHEQPNRWDLRNFRLIAAALDLYAAGAAIDRLLLVIESAVRTADPAHHSAVLDALEANRAALAKAQGIEARQGGDAEGGSVHESPVGAADAPVPPRLCDDCADANATETWTHHDAPIPNPPADEYLCQHCADRRWDRAAERAAEEAC
jgi:hypothetical protein